MVVDDTYNANPESMIAALDTFGGSVAVLGTMGELGERSAEEHRRVLAHAKSLNLEHLILVGDGWADEAVPDAAAAKAKLLEMDVSGKKILLKGSRAMRLEQIVADDQ